MYVCLSCLYSSARYDLLQVTAGTENNSVVVHASELSPHSWGGTVLKVSVTRHVTSGKFTCISVCSSRNEACDAGLSCRSGTRSTRGQPTMSTSMCSAVSLSQRAPSVMSSVRAAHCGHYQVSTLAYPINWLSTPPPSTPSHHVKQTLGEIPAGAA